MTGTFVLPGLIAAFVLQSPPQPGEGDSAEKARSTYATATPDHMRELRFLDTNRDLQIDAEELYTGQEIASMLLMLSWDECDRDGDQVIDAAEFRIAAKEATQALREADEEGGRQAEVALSQAVPLGLVLDQLAADEQYAGEIAALRKETAGLDDDAAVLTYIVKYPARYPRLIPVIKVWGRHYPVHPRIHRVLKPARPPAKARPARPVHPRPRAAKPVPTRPGRPAKRAPRPRRP